MACIPSNFFDFMATRFTTINMIARATGGPLLTKRKGDIRTNNPTRTWTNFLLSSGVQLSLTRTSSLRPMSPKIPKRKTTDVIHSLEKGETVGSINENT